MAKADALFQRRLLASAQARAPSVFITTGLNHRLRRDVEAGFEMIAGSCPLTEPPVRRLFRLRIQDRSRYP
ncbi:MAG: hypothetical protein H6898_16515 [Rhodobacter sp.]|nr:hypothetical protein [Rhodobacter sp.]